MLSASQVYEKIDRICKANLDGETFRREVITILRRAIAFDAWCWPLLDPDTLLSFDGMGDTPFQPQDQLRIFALNYQTRTFPSMRMFALGHGQALRLNANPDGNLTRTDFWEEVYGSLGVRDEMRISLSTNGRLKRLRTR